MRAPFVSFPTGSVLRFRVRLCALALAAFCVPALSCQVLSQLGDTLGDHTQDPDFAFQKAELLEASLEGLTLRLHTEITNFYPFDIPKGGLDLGLKLDGVEFTRLQNDLRSGLPRRERTPVAFDVQIPFARVLRVVQNAAYSQDKDFLLGIAGDLKVDLPERGRALIPGLPAQMSVPVEHETPLPALYPEIEIRNFSVQRPTMEETASAAGGALADAASNYLDGLFGGGRAQSAEEAGLGSLNTLEISSEFDIVVRNRAGALFLINSLNYDFDLAGADFAKGFASSITETPEGESVATIRTSLPIASIGTALARALRYQRADFTLSGKGDFLTPEFSVGSDAKLDFSKNGVLSW